MVRTLVSILLLAVALLVAPLNVAAGSPNAACANASSGFIRMDRDAWWANTLEGFVNEGLDVYDQNGEFTAEFDAFAASFGFGDGAGLEYFVRVTQWAAIDKNENGFTCLKERPDTKGNPDYFVTGVDDSAH